MCNLTNLAEYRRALGYAARPSRGDVRAWALQVGERRQSLSLLSAETQQQALTWWNDYVYSMLDEGLTRLEIRSRVYDI